MANKNSIPEKVKKATETFYLETADVELVKEEAFFRMHKFSQAKALIFKLGLAAYLKTPRVIGKKGK